MNSYFTTVKVSPKLEITYIGKAENVQQAILDASTFIIQNAGSYTPDTFPPEVLVYGEIAPK